VRKGKRRGGCERLGAIAVLFSGPSGTGKTVAGDVLGLSILRIDLSRVVGKYIGETEKNLDRVFADAKGSGAILFFDEADALFGKRASTHDSHDRYANPQIASLLRRMERYPGIAVLATKPRRAIDRAARRQRHRTRRAFDFLDARLKPAR
jgi:SpoVK/Ycf46/Vps4 family AAA+-type ATPase